MRRKLSSLIAMVLLIWSLAFISPTETYAANEDASSVQILLEEDFEDGIADGWELGEGWTIKSDDGNYVLAGNLHSFARVPELGVVTVLESKIKLLRGAAHLNVREKLVGRHIRYMIGLAENSVYFQKQIGQDFSLWKQTEADLELNRWYTVRIEVGNQSIRVLLDNRLILTAYDQNMIDQGGISFETLQDSEAYFDDVKVVGIVEIVAPPFIDGEHFGDIVINESKIMIIEDGSYAQYGNIYVTDNAKLVLRNAELMIGRGEVPTIHTYIFVSGRASLEIEKSTIFPERPTDKMAALVVVRARGRAKIDITDSPTSIHLLQVGDNAQVTITNSEMIFEIGGLLQVGGGNTKVINSTIGAININAPANSHLEVSGLKSGVYLESWDVHDIIPDADYSLVLEKTHILKDELEPGPYERGWIFFINPQAHARISDSELRKVFLTFRKENIKLENLRLGVPSSLKYKNIELRDIIIKGQWGITLEDSNGTISNSEYLFIQIRGESILTLIDSHMVEFIPRDFFGTIIFENCTWTNAGEIIGGQPYHSMENNFTIKGSLKIGPELRKHLQWKDAQVKRNTRYSFLTKGVNQLRELGLRLMEKNS